MSFEAIKDIESLEALYGTPGEASIVKVADNLTPKYRALIEASPFFALASVGPEGLDCSPRGERGGAFKIKDDKTIIIPDRRGNNRIDTLRNIVRDGRIGMLFLIPGAGTTIRLNGKAIVTKDPSLLESLLRDGKEPRSAIIVTIEEIYTQCSRAIMRSDLWNSKHFIQHGDIPTVGDVLKEQTQGRIDSVKYDKEWPDRAKKTMW